MTRFIPHCPPHCLALAFALLWMGQFFLLPVCSAEKADMMDHMNHGLKSDSHMEPHTPGPDSSPPNEPASTESTMGRTTMDEPDPHASHAMEAGMDPDPMELHKDHLKMMAPAEKAADQAPQMSEKELAAKVRVDEKLGQIIDLDVRFFDENGKPVIIRDIFDKPVVLLPVYYFCPTICSYLQSDLANVLNTVDQMPGKDFNVVCLSFSDDETFEHAQDAKKNYVRLLKKEFPLENWYYLTGTRENILRLTSSMGYYFIKQKKHLYVHPNALVVLAKDGMITRYIYGPNFLPFDVGMALVEADRGETGLSIKRGVMSFCFNYDPDKKTYVLNVFRIAGSIILALLAGFVMVLVFSPFRKRKQ